MLLKTVASSREDAWIETVKAIIAALTPVSRPPARTRGLKLYGMDALEPMEVASSREDAWIETSLYFV